MQEYDARSNGNKPITAFLSNALSLANVDELDTINPLFLSWSMFGLIRDDDTISTYFPKILKKLHVESLRILFSFLHNF